VRGRERETKIGCRDRDSEKRGSREGDIEGVVERE
jgi:hypothetical protein